MEIWKDIPGFEKKYQVSNLGRIKSLDRMRRKHHYPGRVLNTTKRLTHDGYARVPIRDDFGKQHEYRVNKLVATVFIPNPKGKSSINHIDGNKLNNAVCNLEWVTRSENMKHAYLHGLKKPVTGTKNGNAKLTAEQVMTIRSEYVPYSRTHGTVALGKKYGITNAAIGRVVRGTGYKDVK
ncbi:NUMOD4 domain-containing protein [Levilactobacillus brevis]|uniref:NUMOD4 domain-containing protein n=1 Tax=Levilactobacillus brevis TaxID=1580 RepID=UPI0006984A49|nr:NUMOD4 domain-containing protein [Levilactobacillus brevis]